MGKKNKAKGYTLDQYRDWLLGQRVGMWGPAGVSVGSPQQPPKDIASIELPQGTLHEYKEIMVPMPVDQCKLCDYRGPMWDEHWRQKHPLELRMILMKELGLDAQK